MKTPDYKKRAAKAAEDWSQLQAQNDSKSKDFTEDIYVSEEIENQSIEQTVAELIDDLSMPKTKVKGIHIKKNQVTKEKLRNSA